MKLSSIFRFQHISNGLALATGALYAWSKYFSVASDPYSNSPSPWEPRMHDAHLLVVPVLLFACGILWQSHVIPQWNARASRNLGKNKKFSGLGILCVLIPMVATGYLIQVAVDESWRKAWVILHLATSALWVVGYAVHIIVPSRRTERVIVESMNAI